MYFWQSSIWACTGAAVRSQDIWFAKIKFRVELEHFHYSSLQHSTLEDQKCLEYFIYLLIVTCQQWRTARCFSSKWGGVSHLEPRGGQINPNIDSIDTTTGIGIRAILGSILFIKTAFWFVCFFGCFFLERKNKPVDCYIYFIYSLQ